MLSARTDLHGLVRCSLGVQSRMHLNLGCQSLRSHSSRYLSTPAASLLSSSSSSPTLPPTSSLSSRKDALRHARPLSDFLCDTFGRQHTYLRISLTERCNLRCVYCMPEAGVPLSPARDLLTTPEIILLARLFVAHGVTKIRLTGREPTVRSDFVALVRRLGEMRQTADGGNVPGPLKELCITTNGVALHRKLDDLVAAGLTGVNLSLDTLDPWQFQIMTRRLGFDAVLKSMHRILDINNSSAGQTSPEPRIRLKINCVIMRGVNEHQILPFVRLTERHDLEVRFIEYMPFDGNRWNRTKMVSYAEMLDAIRAEFPAFERAASDDMPTDTSKTWRVPGFAGRVGFITSMTHNFCGTCNRLRITSEGNLKVCLFGDAEVSLRDRLRELNGGEPMDEQTLERLERFAREERAAAAMPSPGPIHARAVEDEDADMLRDAGIPAEHAKKLFDVIGAAVKRKKARHAGMGTLEHIKNRPMVLIGG